MHALPLPSGVPSRLAIWRLDLALDAPLSTLTLTLLTQDEVVHCLQYRQHPDRVRFATTRAALRSLLAQRLALAPQAIQLTMGSKGKPALTSGPFFNVSHAGDHALLAISDTLPVGIDIEKIDTACDLAELAKTVFNPDECAYCQHAPAAFYALWTGKEAVLKAWGYGIAEHLSALAMTVHTDDPEFTLKFLGQPEAATRAWQIAAPDGYAAALALGSPARNLAT
ncbi:MAG: 4'-phosphopantetheinyl transferase superfamily protein [Pseudomonadota bacterium]